MKPTSLIKRFKVLGKIPDFISMEIKMRVSLSMVKVEIMSTTTYRS
jgi:hypothetical protein